MSCPHLSFCQIISYLTRVSRPCRLFFNYLEQIYVDNVTMDNSKLDKNQEGGFLHHDTLKTHNEYKEMFLFKENS